MFAKRLIPGVCLCLCVVLPLPSQAGKIAVPETIGGDLGRCRGAY
jgi:hypothetical protein